MGDVFYNRSSLGGSTERRAIPACRMFVQRSQVIVRWENGLHGRTASMVVRLAHTFRSKITLRYNEQIASARSILSVMLLCAAAGSVLQVEAEGDDEERAIQAVQQVFEQPDGPPGAD